MAILPAPLDYTAKDFASLRIRLRNLARTVFPDWTDFNNANIGNLLLELSAHVGDVTTFYQDAQAAEAFLPTLTQRESLIRHGRLVGYTLPGAVAAAGSLRFTLPAAQGVIRTVAAGSRARAIGPGDPIQFRTTAVGTIGIGSLFVDVAAENATQLTEVVTSTEVVNFEVGLTRAPFLDGSTTVTANEGAYTRVDSFLGSTANNLHYVVLVDQSERARVRFGNGVTGRIPTGTVTVTYKIGGGAVGNVDANRIVIIEGSITDGFGAVPVSVNNPAAFSGGADRISVELGRIRAPQAVRSQVRTVSRQDFVDNALAVPGVIRAAMVTRNEDVAVAENTGRLQIVAAGARTVGGRTVAAAPSSTLITAVQTMVRTTRPHTLTFVVTVEGPTFRTINVSTRIYLTNGAAEATTATNIRNALVDLFAATLADGTPNPGIDFGANILNADGTISGEITWSTVFNEIHDASGVRKVDENADGLLLNSLRQSVVLAPREFPLLGTITIINAATGLAI